MMRSERGITILGFLFVAAVVIVVALVGFRVLPIKEVRSRGLPDLEGCESTTAMFQKYGVVVDVINASAI